MLDGKTHLVKQGWKGTGHPLKTGGRARPVVIAQKKTLGGIGKDRDESFAFWDHLYDVAAKTVKLKLPGDDSSTDGDQDVQAPTPTLHRTQTGILSNRRPTMLPTPSSSKSASPQPSSTSIISLAKKEAARRVLYSQFLRGPIITQETLDSESAKHTETITSTSVSTASSTVMVSSSGPSIAVSETTVTQAPADDKQQGKAEKAARTLAKEERRQAKAARRQEREERRLAKAVRDEAKAAKKLRKVERAAKRAAKLEKKRQREVTATAQADLSDEDDGKEDRAKRKQEKKRKRDEQ